MLLPFSANTVVQAELFVKQLFRDNLPTSRTFHSVKHTAMVVEKCMDMIKFYQLSASERTILLVGAWFHDTGYCNGSIQHEMESVNIAKSFLSQYDINNLQLDEVVSLIMATRLPVNPKTTLERIICDADMHHLGSPEYSIWAEQLKKETEFYSGNAIDAHSWTAKNIAFFNAHQFYTTYAKEQWAPQKTNNLAGLMMNYE